MGWCENERFGVWLSALDPDPHRENVHPPSSVTLNYLAFTLASSSSRQTPSEVWKT